VIGIDIGRNSFHIVGLDRRGAIVLRQKWSRGQSEIRLANLPPCLIGMDALNAHRAEKKRRSGLQSACDELIDKGAIIIGE
jgi:transposase